MFKFNLPRAYFFGILFFILSTIVPMASYAQDRMDQITFDTGNNNKGKSQWQTFCGKLVEFNESQVKFQFMTRTGFLLQEPKTIHRSRINMIHFGFYDEKKCQKESVKNKVDRDAVKNIVAQPLSSIPLTKPRPYYPMNFPLTIGNNSVALIYFDSNFTDDQEYIKKKGCYVVTRNDPDESPYSYFYGFPIIKLSSGDILFACLPKTSRYDNAKPINIPISRPFLKIFFQYGKWLK